jgi:hypothetical protein
MRGRKECPGTVPRERRHFRKKKKKIAVNGRMKKGGTRGKAFAPEAE